MGSLQKRAGWLLLLLLLRCCTSSIRAAHGNCYSGPGQVISTLHLQADSQRQANGTNCAGVSFSHVQREALQDRRAWEAEVEGTHFFTIGVRFALYWKSSGGDTHNYAGVGTGCDLPSTPAPSTSLTPAPGLPRPKTGPRPVIHTRSPPLV